MIWPEGFAGSGMACGIKGSGVSDLGVIVAEAPVAWAGTFTKNAAAAAPVTWSRARLGRPVRAVVVNSGNANACTGPAGDAAVETTARAAAAVLGCTEDEILVASTGPIGVPLPVDRLVGALPDAIDGVHEHTGDFAHSIMTTDTTKKLASANVGSSRILGVAKGAAMLAPNMATMLAFLVTDASVDGMDVQSMLDDAVRRSFDRICVDACESTNDSVFLLVSGRSGPADARAFADALERVCKDLALQMVRDAEGATKVMRVAVSGARDEDHAVKLGKAVAASDLWRCAAHGGDPNWGRVLAALGSIERIDLTAVTVTLGREVAFAGGAPRAPWDALAKQMAGDEIDVGVSLAMGTGAAEILSADLSPDYVRLNAYGTS